ncbi:WD40 repeat-like protein [Mycena sanguinolenta]|uniref:WD40 repeat-like protein n=1 Tax=Mycena sanguinolenta TaxID=230812 RepID=A0A8H6ZDU5_9AGAR|nr:WD40 repeat-like protein [Mycena sanguinolenta]
MSLDNSPFVDRLNTNYVPSDLEVIEIRTLLAEPEIQLARIDAQIEKMEIVLAQLKEQCASLRRPIDAHKVLLSPIRRIPHDVLVEIFLACLPSKHHALIDPTQAPMLLGRICRHWSRVVYSTPMLWRSIHIPPPNYLHTPPNILSRLEKIVEDWLERSGTCALALSIFDPGNFSHNLERHPLVSRLLPFSRRLRHLAITGDLALFRPLLCLGSEDLPLLKDLRMHSIVHSPNLDNLFQAHTLEEIALNMTASIDPRSLPLPWSQLTELYLRCTPAWEQHSLAMEGGLDIGGAFDVLRRCPNLVQCELKITKIAPDSIFDTSPINLLHLCTLVLSGSGFVFQKWASHLVVPNLRSLQIGDVFWDSAARSLAQDSSLSVDIGPGHFTPSSLAECFQSFPLISHLQLSAAIFSSGEFPHDALLALFAPPHELCPMLTNMAILDVLTTPSDLAVLTFVKTRMAMPTPLQQIRVRCARQMELDIMPELEALISDGLQVDITYPPRSPNFYPGLGIIGEGYA